MPRLVSVAGGVDLAVETGLDAVYLDIETEVDSYEPEPFLQGFRRSWRLDSFVFWSLIVYHVREQFSIINLIWVPYSSKALLDERWTSEGVIWSCLTSLDKLSMLSNRLFTDSNWSNSSSSLNLRASIWQFAWCCLKPLPDQFWVTFHFAVFLNNVIPVLFGFSFKLKSYPCLIAHTLPTQRVL